MKAVYDIIFAMTVTGNWSFTEVYNFPVKLRDYYYERFVELKKEEKKKIEDAKK